MDFQPAASHHAKSAMESLRDIDTMSLCSPYSAALQRRVCHLGVVRPLGPPASLSAGMLLQHKSSRSSALSTSNKDSEAAERLQADTNDAEEKPKLVVVHGPDSPFYQHQAKGPSATSPQTSDSTSSPATPVVSAKKRKPTLEDIINNSNSYNEAQRRKAAHMGSSVTGPSRAGISPGPSPFDKVLSAKRSSSTSDEHLQQDDYNLTKDLSSNVDESGVALKPALYPQRTHFEYRPYSAFEVFEQNGFEAGLRSGYRGEGQPPPAIRYRPDPEPNQHFLAITKKKGKGRDASDTDASIKHDMSHHQSNFSVAGAPQANVDIQNADEEPALARQGALDATAHLVSRPNYNFTEKRFTNRGSLYVEYLRTSSTYIESLGVDITSPLPTPSSLRLASVDGAVSTSLHNPREVAAPRPATSLGFTHSPKIDSSIQSTSLPSNASSAAVAHLSRNAARAHSAAVAASRIRTSCRMVPLNQHGGNLSLHLSVEGPQSPPRASTSLGIGSRGPPQFPSGRVGDSSHRLGAAGTSSPLPITNSRGRNITTVASFATRRRPMTSTEVAQQQRAASASQHQRYVADRLKEARELQHLTRLDHPLRTTVYC